MELTAGLRGFSREFGDQCTTFPDNQYVQKWRCTVSIYFHGKLDSSLKIFYVSTEFLYTV